MLKRNLGPVGVMGFARYKKRHDASADDLIDAARRWQHEFLASQAGIAFHAFLGNTRGEFADAILAVDLKAFEDMTRRHSEAESSDAFMQLLDLPSVRLCRNTILKEGVLPPEDFSCVEFGTFRIKPGTMATEETVRRASNHIEETYLRGSSNTRLHFVGKIDEQTYCEVAFGHTLAETKRICRGYVGDPDCQPLLELFDPESVDLDFWYVLA